MELKNVALYCKYWYKRRENTSELWKDLSVCIANDGYAIRETKREVVRWILHQMDENYEWFKKAKGGYYGFGWFLDEIQKKLDWDKWSNHPENIDNDDAIILTYMSLVCNTNGDMFDKCYYPDPRILPINLSGPEIKEGRYWKPAEMLCEWEERIKKQFPKHIEQDTKEPYWTRESFDKCYSEKYHRLMY